MRKGGRESGFGRATCERERFSPSVPFLLPSHAPLLFPFYLGKIKHREEPAGKRQWEHNTVGERWFGSGYCRVPLALEGSVSLV